MSREENKNSEVGKGHEAGVHRQQRKKEKFTLTL